MDRKINITTPVTTNIERVFDPVTDEVFTNREKGWFKGGVSHTISANLIVILSTCSV